MATNALMMCKPSRFSRGTEAAIGVFMLRYVGVLSTFTTLALFACEPLPGDRAMGGNGCPPGEICSPQAPKGLFFEGETLSSAAFDRGDHPTAVGGQQHYSIFRSAEREPILVPFSIEIDGAAEVVSTAAATVTIMATSTGWFQLRVLDLDGALLDSISLPSAEIESASISPTAGAIIGGPFDINEPPLYFEGESTALVLSLQASSGRALVDNQATAQMGTRRGWDFYEDVVPTNTIVDVVAAGVDFTAPLETVSSIDDVSVSNRIDDRLEVLPNSSLQPCFAAHFGTRQVHGAPWTFSLTGQGMTLDGIQLERCVDVRAGDSPETSTLTVTAGDRQETFAIDVASNREPAPAVVADGAEQRERGLPMRGDRAAHQLAAQHDEEAF